MLNTTKVELGLLSDIDMLLFCERAIRGGINGIGAMRHFKANNKYMEDFDKSQPTVFGAFFDVTSLYAGTMQQPLPCGNYKWRSDLTIDDILNADCFGGVGYFVEVDLEYPPHLHDDHNDLPLAPKNYKLKLNGYRTMPTPLEFQHPELPSWSKLFSIKTSIFAILEI